ncbi:MAG: HIRAN domain-containing protein [Rhizobiales bacterium]|nr:HIRAN domain-containing protein [Hyphomicrobiales bacterium]
MRGAGAFTRREVNRALLATAFAMLGGGDASAGAPTRLFDFAIAGGDYYELEDVLERIGPGVKLTLAREPANPYDADAVAVHLDGVKLGFIPRSANTPVARLLDGGARVSAEVVRMLDIERYEDVPEELVYTSFLSGDPMIRLTVGRQA